MNGEIRIFGYHIVPKPMNLHENLPLIYSNQYKFYSAIVADVSCIFIQYYGNYLSIPRIKKSFEEIPKLLKTNANCVLWLTGATEAQKTRLIDNHIPFFVDQKTVYLPFLGWMFDLHTKAKLQIFRSQFSAATQCVFIDILLGETDHCQVKDIQNRVMLSHVSVSAALRELYQKNLLEVSGNNTRKKYRRISKNMFWKEGHLFLSDPVFKRYYISNLNLLDRFDTYYAGESALAKLSMISSPLHPCVALSKLDYEKICKYAASSPDDLFDENYSIIEIWRYNPGLFADKDKNVDPFSLYASLGDLLNDERVAGEMEIMIERYLNDAGD